ncbi:uncharacterized protein LOC112568726 [Pomacea canaliculata]|uniref:uncharacterized protein LOC112568726 n=1 Tax=Pomacea canaliculata TaxID=400727 RepID=UPI000D73E028|nr:uncharacterized protein LOC112568726 [Pomacea canaliculata]
MTSNVLFLMGKWISFADRVLGNNQFDFFRMSCSSFRNHQIVCLIMKLIITIMIIVALVWQQAALVDGCVELGHKCLDWVCCEGLICGTPLGKREFNCKSKAWKPF